MHYTFNLRDISKVFGGVCNASVKYVTDTPSIIRCWYHEIMRVFHDRLIDDPDREFIKNTLKESFPRFGVEEDAVLNMKRIIFVDFW